MVDAAGKAVAPNVFVAYVNEKDHAAFGDLEKPLLAKLLGAAWGSSPGWFRAHYLPHPPLPILLFRHWRS